MYNFYIKVKVEYNIFETNLLFEETLKNKQTLLTCTHLNDFLCIWLIKHDEKYQIDLINW